MRRPAYLTNSLLLLCFYTSLSFFPLQVIIIININIIIMIINNIITMIMIIMAGSAESEMVLILLVFTWIGPEVCAQWENGLHTNHHHCCHFHQENLRVMVCKLDNGGNFLRGGGGTCKYYTVRTSVANMAYLGISLCESC